jgi:hypothetical protein
MIPILLLAAALSAHAMTVTATLVSSRIGTTVTGQSVVICTYSYGGQKFEKLFPIGTNCPISIQIQ